MTATLVFDNTPLSHFARVGRLGVLEKLYAPYRRVVPSEVMRELSAGLSDRPSLASAITAGRLDTVELDRVDELVAFARYKSELCGGDLHHNGEAAVLAWTTVHGGSRSSTNEPDVASPNAAVEPTVSSAWVVAKPVELIDMRPCPGAR